MKLKITYCLHFLILSSCVQRAGPQSHQSRLRGPLVLFMCVQSLLPVCTYSSLAFLFQKIISPNPSPLSRSLPPSLSYIHRLLLLLFPAPPYAGPINCAIAVRTAVALRWFVKCSCWSELTSDVRKRRAKKERKKDDSHSPEKLLGLPGGGKHQSNVHSGSSAVA